MPRRESRRGRYRGGRDRNKRSRGGPGRVARGGRGKAGRAESAGRGPGPDSPGRGGWAGCSSRVPGAPGHRKEGGPGRLGRAGRSGWRGPEGARQGGRGPGRIVRAGILRLRSIHAPFALPSRHLALPAQSCSSTRPASPAPGSGERWPLLCPSSPGAANASAWSARLSRGALPRAPRSGCGKRACLPGLAVCGQGAGKGWPPGGRALTGVRAGSVPGVGMPECPHAREAHPFSPQGPQGAG